MTTRIAADIQIRASLIDDYLQVEDAPVAPGLTGRFVALQDPAAPATRSLVTVHPDGSLIQFAPDPTSHSGWAVTTVPVTPPANTAAQPNRLAGYVQGATSNLLAYFPVQGAAGSAAVWMQAEAGAAGRRRSSLMIPRTRSATPTRPIPISTPRATSTSTA